MRSINKPAYERIILIVNDLETEPEPLLSSKEQKLLEKAARKAQLQEKKAQRKATKDTKQDNCEVFNTDEAAAKASGEST